VKADDKLEAARAFQSIRFLITINFYQVLSDQKADDKLFDASMLEFFCFWIIRLFVSGLIFCGTFELKYRILKNSGPLKYRIL
jgi:hypothetical protein